jgi:alanine dehydrogenase
MPGAVGRTSTYALCNATFPYLLHMANRGLVAAARENPELVSAVNVHDGKVTHPAVAQTFGLTYTPFEA